LLFEVFGRLYPKLEAPQKVPFARPMDEWLSGYDGPLSSVFKEKIDMSALTGDQKYLIRSLDKFVSLLEGGVLCR
jgi:hypothetical protein